MKMVSDRFSHPVQLWMDSLKTFGIDADFMFSACVRDKKISREKTPVFSARREIGSEKSRPFHIFCPVHRFSAGKNFQSSENFGLLKPAMTQGVQNSLKSYEHIFFDKPNKDR